MKIGIITMHKVLNYGSALQAYALQQKLKELGYDNEIIDYEFPLKSDTPLFSRIDREAREFIFRLRTNAPIFNTKAHKFRKFYKKYLKLSPFSCNRLNISAKQFDYDLLMTGSDQVWNPTFIKKDTNFFLSFGKEETPRLSYASSFAIDEIPKEFEGNYKTYLSKYSTITVREATGVKLIKELTSKNALVTCDPTLLLTPEHYLNLASNVIMELPEKYILVYLLGYMYNPYPEVNNIIKNIHDSLGIPVIYLDGSKYLVYDKSCKVISDLSPCEFVSIFNNASFVVTSSFHGTAFSIILQRPFISILKKGVKDSRIKSLLTDTYCEESMVYHDQNFVPKSDLAVYICKANALREYRNKSIEILHDMLKPYKV